MEQAILLPDAERRSLIAKVSLCEICNVGFHAHIFAVASGQDYLTKFVEMKKLPPLFAMG